MGDSGNPVWTARVLACAAIAFAGAGCSDAAENEAFRRAYAKTGIAITGYRECRTAFQAKLTQGTSQGEPTAMLAAIAEAIETRERCEETVERELKAPLPTDAFERTREALAEYRACRAAFQSQTIEVAKRPDLDGMTRLGLTVENQVKRAACEAAVDARLKEAETRGPQR